MWHGGGLTGATYETKPDGGAGWGNFFIRKGLDVYISDAMERGRSGWTDKFKGEPMFLPLNDPWVRFRIGDKPSDWDPDPAKRKTYPGMQFPVEAYEQFMKQGVPRWLTTDDEIVAAYIALVDKVCPCAVMVHSQSGSFGFRVLEARPDMIKALIAVEPTVGGDKNKVASIKNTPIMMMYGDNVKAHARWSKIRQGGVGLRRCPQGGRRQRRHLSICPTWAERKFPHDHDGQEQRSGCRSHPEMAPWQGTGGVSRQELSICGSLRRGHSDLCCGAAR